MSNALIAYNNELLNNNWTYTVDGWATYTGTVTYLTTLSLAQRWVTAGLSTSEMRIGTITFAGNPTIAMLVLANHNLTLAATVRIMASNLADFSVMVYDSGAVSAFAAGVTAASRTGMRWNFAHKLSTPTSATYWRIEISDGSNPAGYLAAGRLAAFTSVFQPTVNMSAGAGIGWTDTSDVQVALSGAEWFVDREPYRSARFRLAYLTTDEMLRGAFDLQRVAAGARREIWFQYDPDDGEHSVRRSMFGRLRQISAIEEPYANGLETGLEVKELL